MNNAAIHLCHTGHAEKSANRWKPGFETDGVGDAVRMAWMRGLLGRGSPSGRPDETCFVPMRVQCCNLNTCIACRCADEPASRATAQPHGGTRRRPAADETRALAPANGADRPGRGRQRTVTRTRQTPPHGRGPAPVAEPRGRVRVDHCICEPSVLALYPAAEPSAEPRPASAHGPRRRTYDTRHIQIHLTYRSCDLIVST